MAELIQVAAEEYGSLDDIIREVGKLNLLTQYLT